MSLDRASGVVVDEYLPTQRPDLSTKNLALGIEKRVSKHGVQSR